jgi:hypothetical protein
MEGNMELANVYVMHGGRIFIPVKKGRKWVTGLIMKADGWATKKVPADTEAKPALYKGKPYPARKMRGHLRRFKAATKAANKYRKELLA